jgi:hypothetical protein
VEVQVQGYQESVGRNGFWVVIGSEIRDHYSTLRSCHRRIKRKQEEV